MKSRSFAALLLLAPVAAYAQYTYRCTTVDGKKYYGATIPQQCVGQPIEQLSPSGTVMRRIDPEGDEKMRRKGEDFLAQVREFCETAFAEAGLDYKDFVVTDDRFLRPPETEILVGNASRARQVLGWERKVGFTDLVREMVRSDLRIEGVAGR